MTTTDQHTDLTLTFVVPVYNERATLEELVRRCRAAVTLLEIPFRMILVMMEAVMDLAS